MNNKLCIPLGKNIPGFYVLDHIVYIFGRQLELLRSTKSFWMFYVDHIWLFETFIAKGSTDECSTLQGTNGQVSGTDIEVRCMKLIIMALKNQYQILIQETIDGPWCLLTLIRLCQRLVVINYSGGSRISRRGGVDLGGVWTPEAVTFWKFCMSKRKNWDP